MGCGWGMGKGLYEDGLWLSSFIALFEIGLLLVGGLLIPETYQFSTIDYLFLALFLFGSYLNTYSELQRKWWKNNVQNRGKVYTQGLFSHSMHINFFGDVVLFSGWSFMTHNLWTLGLPLLMLVSFIFFHIPALDSYLSSRYGEAFDTYAKNTKKLIPFIY